MIKITNILVPTDFSESAMAAYEYALSIAKTFQSKIYLIHVYEPLVYYSEAPLGLPDMFTMEQNIQAASEQSMKKIVDEYFHGRRETYGDIEVESILTQGKPFIEIIKAAREKNADMIIMSSHGRSALEHILLGSVTEKVVRKAPCPVLTVRGQGAFKMP